MYKLRQSKRTVAQTATIPAPTGGLNDRDSLANMPATDAIILDNLFPDLIGCSLRLGYQEWATGLANSVESLLVYYVPSGADKLFAAAGGNFYDISLPVQSPAAAVSGLLSDRWQWINYSNAGGHYLIAVDGVDDLQRFDGSAWTAVTAADITGVDPKTFVDVAIHKNRLWFVQNATSDAWYLAANAIQGAATKFPLGGIFKRGGALVKIHNWTLDGGAGMDDYLAFFSSNGEIAVYQGTDPGSASDWALTGLYFIGPPVSQRFTTDYGGDILMLVQSGVYPMSRAFQSATINTQETLSNKIQRTLSRLLLQYRTQFGWQIYNFPGLNWLIINVPSVEGVGERQYIMNTISGAWCRFTGLSANQWVRFGDNLFFATPSGEVMLYGASTFDAVLFDGTGGQPVIGHGVPAFSYFGLSGQSKRWTLFRPVVSSGGDASILAQINTDFAINDPLGFPSAPPGSSAQWDLAIWDVDLWAGDLNVRMDWMTAQGIGYCATVNLLATGQQGFQWIATDFVYESGGVL